MSNSIAFEIITGFHRHSVTYKISLSFVFPASELRVESLDAKIIENRKEHHTDEYEHVCLIVRRGQAFSIQINFDREFSKEKDTVLLQLTYGKKVQ